MYTAFPLFHNIFFLFLSINLCFHVIQALVAYRKTQNLFLFSPLETKITDITTISPVYRN